MDRFPPAIVISMRQTGAMCTCVPVQYSDDSWESTVFFEVGGPECKADRRVLRRAQQPLPIGIEAEVIKHDHASVVMLRFEVMTDQQNPLAGEVLLAPGLGNVQFETLKLLGEQRNLRFYFADSAFNVIYSQQLPLNHQERDGYSRILEEVVSNDALIRLTGKYDAMAALSNVVSLYDVRTPT